MNKSELIAVVRAKLGSRKLATQAVDAVIEAIVSAIAKGDRISIRGLGTFERAQDGIIAFQSRAQSRRETEMPKALGERARAEFVEVQESERGSRAIPPEVGTGGGGPRIGTRHTESRGDNEFER